MKKRIFPGLENITVDNDTVIITINTGRREQSAAQKAGFIGVAGGFDEDGLLIPKGFFKKANKALSYPVKKKHGCTTTPMRRSLYSGKRYKDRASKRKGDTKLRKMCSDPEYFQQLMKYGYMPNKMSPEVKEGWKKYLSFLHKTDGFNRRVDKIPQREGYMRIDGVVRIRKTMKARKSLTGVVVQEDNNVS